MLGIIALVAVVGIAGVVFCALPKDIKVLLICLITQIAVFVYSGIVNDFNFFNDLLVQGESSVVRPFIGKASIVGFITLAFAVIITYIVAKRMRKMMNSESKLAY